MKNIYASLNGVLVRGVLSEDGYGVERFDPDKGQFVLDMEYLTRLTCPEQTGDLENYRLLTQAEFDAEVKALAGN